MSNEETNSARARTITREIGIGRSCEARGEWNAAFAAYQRALILCETDVFQDQKARVLRWVGHIHAGQNRWPEAQNAYEESLRLCRIAGDAIGEADALNGLGTLRFEQGKLDEALQFYDQAMTLADREQDPDLTATIFNNKGAVSNVRGDWQIALACYEESVPRFERGGNMKALANTYLNMAITHADNGNWSTAEHFYEKSYRLAKELEEAHLLATIKLNRVELYLAVNDIRIAAALCLQALQSYTRMQDQLGRADAYKMLGIVYARSGEFPLAESSLQESIRLSREYNGPLCEAEAHAEYGRVLRINGVVEEARGEIRRALDLFRKLNAKKEIEALEAELEELSKVRNG